VLLHRAESLGGIPAILINGRFDLQAPLGNAWMLHESWPGSELVVVDDAGHAGDDEKIARELIRASDRFAQA
jgi:proline iminopeptidase